MAEWITRLVPLNDYEHGTSLNVGIVKGGMGANTLAENAQCEVDIRFTNIEACHKIEAAFENLRTNPKIRIPSAYGIYRTFQKHVGNHASGR